MAFTESEEKQIERIVRKVAYEFLEKVIDRWKSEELTKRIDKLLDDLKTESQAKDEGQGERG